VAEILLVGTLVAGYRIDGLLGEGGMGVVYEGTQLSLDRKVALKIIAPGLSADSGFRARFRREGLIQARVEHPNIVTVYEAGDYDGLLFLAMRLVRGSSLRDILDDEAPEAPRILRILGSVADALDSAHEVGLIHRDVKPHNVLVGQRDHPYLADFGITKDIGDTGLTQTGQFMGSLDYIAPEQIRGEQVTGSCDVYALTAVLFECLTGVVPFAKDSEAAILYAHIADPPPKLSDYRPHLPKALDEVIAQGMAKEPTERPQTAMALIEAAEECFGEQPHTAIGSIVGNPPDPQKGSTGRRQSSALGSEPPGRGASSAGATVTADPKPILAVERPEQGEEAHVVAPRRRRRVRHALVMLAAAATVTVGAGYAIGHASGSAGTSLQRTLSTDAASVTLAGRWSATVAPSVPGLSLSDPAVARSSAGEVLALGVVPEAEGRYLLPATFERSLAATPKPGGVRIGTAMAYRYKDLHVKGFPKPITLILIPTTSGAVALLCVPHTSSDTPVRTCETVAGTMRLSGTDPLPLGPNPGYARQLALAISNAQSAEASERALTDARTRAGQARLSSMLAGVYDAAAGLLAKASPGPDAAASNGRLLDALRQTARGYSAMATAAHAGQPDRFREAASRRLVSQRSIRSLLVELRSDGYA
jgi:serine/threonine protein kinase